MGKTKKPKVEPEEFQVEVVTAARVVSPSSSDDDESDNQRSAKRSKKKNKHAEPKWEYYVKWAGYSSDDNSWEPHKNLLGCQRLLQSFWNHVGMDDEDHLVGYEVTATESWIKKEKKLFAQENSTKSSNKKPVKGKGKAKEQRHVSTTSSRNTVPPSSMAKGSEIAESLHDGDGDSDEPLKIIIPLKRKRIVVSDADDDEPLQNRMKHNDNGKPVAKKAKNDASDQVASTSQSQISPQLPRKDSSIAVNPPLRIQIPSPHEQTADTLFSEEMAPSSPLFSEKSSPETALKDLPKQSRPVPLPKKTAPPGQIPKLPVRKPNPHMDLVGIAGGSGQLSKGGISTKQRLSQGALAPVAAKATVRTPSSNVSTLKSLSFHKTPTTPVAPTAPFSGPVVPLPRRASSSTSTPQIPHREPTLASLNSRPSQHSPVTSPTSAYFDIPRATSPEDYTMLDSTPMHIEPYAPTTISPALLHSSTPDLYQEATDFLQSIMPHEMAAPFPNEEENLQKEIIPPLPLRKTLPPLPKITKKWKWSGPLYLCSGAEPELICKVDVFDVPDFKPNGLRFTVAFAPIEKVEILSFHDVTDLKLFFPACKEPQQVALLGPEDGVANNSFNVLRTYMSRKQKVVLIPVHLDGNLIAHMLLFPANAGNLCQELQITPQPQPAINLHIALIPWSLTPSQIAKNSPRLFSSYLPRDISTHWVVDQTKLERTIRSKPQLYRALHILNFPQSLYEYMSGSDRHYCIWHESSDGTIQKPATETVLLRVILDEAKAPEVVYSASPRVVFVHVGALHSLYKLPRFTDRRTNYSLIQFYTYGTHEDVSPSIWGVREIYPCGGVMSFTPGALLNDPLDVNNGIRQVGRHPLWISYIRPVVLGAALKMCCKDVDPLSVLENDEFPLRYLLNAIDDGDIALVDAPPDEPSLAGPEGTAQYERWIDNALSFASPTHRTSVEMSLAALRNSSLSDIPQDKWPSSIEELIVEDMQAMQRQPSIMTNYRRYVVIRSHQENHIHFDREGLEWIVASKFDFKDDFFPRQ